jgi:murein DD-endopeptidase MepM/ murein hydrolase activator NlpD
LSRAALEALFARIFRIVAGKEYLINLQWSVRSSSQSRPLHPSLIRAFAGSAFVLTLGLACLAVEAGQWGYKEIRYRLAVTRHQAFLTDLQEVKGSLASLESALDTAFLQEQKMRALYGINHLDPASAKFGIGGRVYRSPGDSSFSEGLYESLFNTGMKSHQLRGKMDFTLKNMKQITEFVAYRHRLWDHTPSVVPARGSWTSGFGYRLHPITGHYALHEGLDIAGSRWSPIYATADGMVTASESSGNYGKYVEVDHGNGFFTRYGHLNEILVEKGQLVKRYSLLGYMGNTGRATGTHLHYEVIRDGTPQNPERFILPAGLIVD